MTTFSHLPLTVLRTENIIFFLGILFILFLLNRGVKKMKIRYSGWKGEMIVSRLLKKIAKNRFIVMNDIMLPLYNNMTQIDHLVIGPFGVMCVETKNHSGVIKGSMDDVYWKQRLGFRTRSFYNPLSQNQTHVHAVHYFLRKEGLHHVPVYNLVVFSSNNVSIKLNEDHLPVIPVHYLKKYFKDKAFDEPKVDMEKVVEAIQKYQITDKAAKKQHVQRLKKAYDH